MTTAISGTSGAGTKSSRRWLQAIGTLGIATVFTAGIAYMMMALAGYFEPKVKPGPVETRHESANTADNLVEVKLVKRLRTESAVGTIRAVNEAVVASKILARVEEVRVKAGQEVKQGDVLVVLDKADLKSRMEQAQAAEAAASAKRPVGIDFDRSSGSVRQSVTQSELDQANTATWPPRPSWSGRGRRSRRPGSSRRTPPSAPRSAGSSTRRSTPATPSRPARRW